jgi:hypothetical protein
MEQEGGRVMAMNWTITRAEAQDMADAHHLHEDLPREGCPECEGRELGDYPAHPVEVAVGVACPDCHGRIARGDPSGIGYCESCGEEFHPGDEGYPGAWERLR